MTPTAPEHTIAYLPINGAGPLPAARARRSQGLITVALLAPALILLCVLYFYPLLTVLRVSVVEPHQGFDNYVALATSSGLRRVFVTTLRISTITTVVSVTIGYLIAYLMVGCSEGRRKLMFVCVLVPFWISVLVRAFAWVVLLRAGGLVNTLLLQMHLIREPLDLLYNEFGVVVGMVHYMVPIAVLTLYGQLTGIDRRLMMAAEGLGADPFYAFRRVFLPLSIPGIVAASILIFISSLGFYIVPALLGGGKTLMVAEYISILITETVNWGLGTTMASTLVVITLVLIFILSRFVDLRRAFGGA